MATIKLSEVSPSEMVQRMELIWGELARQANRARKKAQG
jgi:hypothetical protein